MKTTRESDIAKVQLNIIYTSDKECTIRYDSEKPICSACYSFEYDGEVIVNCARLQETSTLEQDNELIKKEVKKLINRHFPVEEVRYKVDEREGNQIAN